uniref:Uncharacterized protein n=1 Tax=viral metagenome TaxID=1070528 RepID=A0A6M3JLN2_9ZZZZ
MELEEFEKRIKEEFDKDIKLFPVNPTKSDLYDFYIEAMRTFNKLLKEE